MGNRQRFIRWLRARPRWQKAVLALAALGIAVLGGVAVLLLYSYTQSNSLRYIRRWFADQQSRPALTTPRDPCPGAPFVLPTEGLIGLLWNDPALPYNALHRHTGIDIFGDGAPGTVPVFAAYSGYLTRLERWKSSVIIRHEDPLQPGRTIWTYYTHMANRDGDVSFIDAAFPPGTAGVWVEQGTLIGYQGEYAGDGPPIGMHLHLSIVKSAPDGAFLSEAAINNTLDPSPYFGMPLNIDTQPARPIGCWQAP